MMTCLMGGPVSQEDMFYRRTYVLLEDMFYILREDMSYGRTCLTGGHIFREEIFYKRT